MVKVLQKLSKTGTKPLNNERARRPDKYGSNDGESVRALNAVNRYEKAKYLHALLHPYDVAALRMPVAMPNPIPIPTTTSYHIIKYNYDISTVRTAFKFQVPKLFSGGAPTYNIPMVYRNTSTSTTNYNNWATLGSIYAPVIPLSTKARVVGAEMRMRYVGKLIDQAGTIASAAMFGSSRVTTTVGTAQPMGSYAGVNLPDLSVIHQMTWFEIQNLTQDTLHRCVWAPGDYNDRDFNDAFIDDVSASNIAEGVHDLQWYVDVNGATIGSQVLIEIALIIENQISPSADIFAKNSVSKYRCESDELQPIVEQGMLERNNYSQDNNLFSIIKSLAIEGYHTAKEHIPALLKSGLKAFAAALI